MRKGMLAMAVVALLLSANFAHAQLGTDTVTSNLNVTVAPEAALTIQTASTNFSSVGTNFSDYTAAPTQFTYFVRTTKVGGTGNIQLKITSDFAPAGGPSVAVPPTAGDKLAYTCNVPAALSGSVTQCSGSQTASTSADTAVASFGTDTRSAKAGVSSSVSFTLSNDPVYQTGTYQAVATFTISAS